MKKTILALSVIALGLSAFAGEKVAEYTLPNVKAELVESTAWPGKYMINAEGLLQPIEPLGAPMLPYKTLTFAIPSGYDFKEVVVGDGVEWEVLSEKVKILPIQKPIPVSDNPEKPEYVEAIDTVTKLVTAKVEKITALDVVIVGVTPFRYENERLEKAKNLKLSVVFTEKPRLMSTLSVSPSASTSSPSTSTPLAHPDYIAATLSTLVNPEDAAPKAEQLMAAAQGTAVDYLMISPPDLYDTWSWYIGERKKNHPTLTFDIINTIDAYNAYPFNGWNGETSTTYANPAESLHAYLTQYSKSHALKYVVLGGSWYDVTADNSEAHYLQDGTEITLNNAVPSICMECHGARAPTDLFYACVTRGADNKGHPWDYNGDGRYMTRILDANGKIIDHESEHCNLRPDFAVSRMTMKPVMVNGVTMNQHEIITNFVKKVNRAEDPKFRGNFKMGLTSSPLNYTPRDMTDPRLVLRDEREFFDNVPNMYDPVHGFGFRDDGPLTRRHAKEIMAPRHPIIDAMGFHEPDIVSHNSTKSSFYNDFYNYDKETGSNNGHGWAGGSSMFNSTMFLTQPGLTKINVVGISCETGFPDLYGRNNGKLVLNLCLGEAGLANITETGGFIASMNNTRVGLSYFETEELNGKGLSNRMHYHMCDNVAQGYCAGEAWLNSVRTYLSNGNSNLPVGQKNINEGGLYCMMIEMLYGDPLIKISDKFDYTWAGGSDGTWDMTSQNWTKNGSASTFYHANNINFNVSGGATITMVPNTIEEELGKTELPYGGMTMNVTQNAGSTFELKGTSSLRLMKDLNVSSGTLKIGVSGGVGLGKINFTNTGNLVLNNNNEGQKYYFINGVSNARSIAFQGGGAILDLGGIDNTLQTLSFEGQSPIVSSNNVLRTNQQKIKGELVRFLPLTLKNIALTLETYEAFDGYEGDTLATLNNSVLTFRQNRWRGAKDSSGNNYSERVSEKKLVMTNSTLAVDATEDFYLDKATLEMSGNCRFLTTNGGRFNLIGTTTIYLNEGAVCRLDADFNAGSDDKLVFTGLGRVIVGNADGLDGTIRIGEGVTMEMEKLPLSNLERLEFASGTTIVLPYEEGNFYQVVPIASAMVVEGEFAVKVKAQDEGEIIAEYTQTGTIFQSGTLLEWVSEDEVWTSEKTFKPWRKNGKEAAFDPTERVYFPDIAGSVATVQLATSIVSPFTCFANSTTKYTFKRAQTAVDATLTFDSLVIGGWTHFELPLIFNTRLYVSGGDAEGTEIISPIVEVAAGGIFEATTLRGDGDNWTEITINEGGKLTLQGSHKMNLVLNKGAYLKAENEKYLEWNSTTSIVWPEDGSKVKIDVSDFTPSATPQVIIGGTGHHWNMQDLRKLEVEGDTCSLAVQDGALCLVKRDDIASPYTMTVNSANLNWDDAAWSGNGTAFTKKWSESYLDWTADGVITVAVNNATLTLDKPARFNTLKFVPADDTVKSFTFTIAEGGELKVGELHLEGFENVTLNNVEIEEGILYSATETNIKGPSSGVLVSGGNDSVYIYEPSEKWALGEGAQGALYIAITENVKASRQKVLTIDEDSLWPIGGLDAQAFQPIEGGRTEGFFLSREGTFVYLVPPEIHATVPAGETDWTQLSWRAYDESEVEIENWNDVYAARLEAATDGATVIVGACPTTKLTIGPVSGLATEKLILKANDGVSVKLPSEFTMNGPATIQGDILPVFDYVTGSGVLSLDTGANTTITLNSNVSPVETGHVEVKLGSRLVIHHTQYFSSTTANWSGLTGDGEVEIVQDGNFRFMVPVKAKMFASTLSLVLHTELEMQLDHRTNPMEVSNLSGAGMIGIGNINANNIISIVGNDFSRVTAMAGLRALRTIQSRASEWNGALCPAFKLLGATIGVKLVVAGSESTPSVNRRLIYSGTSSSASGAHSDSSQPLDIETSGCLELNGYWNGDINNSGLLIMGRNARVNSSENLKGNGYITTNGDVIDLTTYSDVASKYKLYSGTTGSIRFNVSAFDAKTEIIPVQSGFMLGEEPLTMVAVAPNGDRRWKAVTMDDIENGKLVWKTEGADAQPLVFDLEAGSSNFTTLVGDAYLGGVSAITFNGNASGDSSVVITDQFRQFTGSLIITGGVTLSGLAPSIATLASNPVGKLIFALGDVSVGCDLIQIADGFTYEADKFLVEVVGPNGETNPMGVWTQSGNKLIYKIANLNDVTTGLKFDQHVNSWGSHGITNLGSLNLDAYTKTRNGYGVKAEKANNNANDERRFYIGPNDWTFAWCARLGTNQNAMHFSLGDNSAGLALTTVDANHAAISRWGGGNSFTYLIQGDVMAATARFYSYALTYHKGVYTFYVDGKKIGEATELTGAQPLPDLVKWQFFSVCGGGVGSKSVDGILDDVRAYDYALPPAAIQALADEFPAWPDAIEVKDNEVVERNVNSFGTEELGNDIYLSGDGTLRLVGIGEARLCLIKDAAKLVISDGVTVRVGMSNNNPAPLNGHEVIVEHGGRLVFEHADNVTALEECDLSNITGEGTVEFFSTASGNYIYPPTNSFASTLSFCNNSTIFIGPSYNTAQTPFKITNLSGSGVFRYDTTNSGNRWIEVTQTEYTLFTGSFPRASGNQPGHFTLTVTSLEETANHKQSLMLAISNANGLVEVVVDEKGCVGFDRSNAVGGEYGAEIVDNGLVVFAPPSNQSIYLSSFSFKSPSTSKVALNGNGTLVIKLNSSFTLDSNPVGIIDASGTEGATGVLKLIHVVDDFEFSKATFRVAGALLDKELAVSDGWLCAAANASVGGTAWSTESGEWTASGFNNGTGTTSGNAVSFEDAVSTTSGGLVNAVTVTVNEDVACSQMNFNSTLSSYTFTGSGSIDCATISLAAGVAPITLSGVTLAQDTIELIVPTSIAVGTRLITWSTPYEKTFTSASLNAAGLTLEKRDDGLYVVEQPVDLDTIFYQFSTETPNYDATKLATSPSSMTIACSLKTANAKEELWAENLAWGATKVKVGLMTGDTANKIKFFISGNGATSYYPSEGVTVPFANKQTHTYIITFDSLSGSYGKWTLYVDGVKAGESGEKELAFLFNNTACSYTHAQTSNEKVYLQDGRLYSRVLNTSEIKAYTELFPKTPVIHRAPRIIVR